jgi:hypothetical protein
MKHSVCYICDKDLLPNEGGIIYFSENESERQIRGIIELHRSTDQPTNAFWFCKDHYIEAKKLSYLSKKEALKILNDKFNNVVQNT